MKIVHLQKDTGEDSSFIHAASRRLLAFKNYIEAMLCRNQNASEMRHVIFVLLFLGLFHSISSQISVKDKRQLVNSCIDGNNHKQEPGPEDSLHQQVMPILLS